MNAKELMKEHSRKYFDEAVKNPLIPHGMGSPFESDRFIEQVFDDIQNEVMCDLHGPDYYDHVGSGDTIDIDYSDTSEVRTDFIREAIEFVAEAISNR